MAACWRASSASATWSPTPVRWSRWSGAGSKTGPLNVVLVQRPGVGLSAGTQFMVTGADDAVRSGQATAGLASPATGNRIRMRAPHPGAEDLAGRVVCGKQPAEASSPGNSLAISPIVIDLSAAELWDPQPDWRLLRACKQQIAAGAEVIARILIEAGWSVGALRIAGGCLCSRLPEATRTPSVRSWDWDQG